MKRIAIILALIGLIGSARAEEGLHVPPMLPSGSNAVLPDAADNVARNQAPRRNRLTATLGHIDAGRGNQNTNSTYFAALPIEAPFTAVRLAVTNPFNASTTFDAMSIWLSDSYAGPLAPIASRWTCR